MKIERPELLSRLTEFALTGNGVVVGCPGGGKSYSLSELRAHLKARGIPHLILPVERLGEGTETEVRNLLKRDGDFVSLLREVSAQSPTKPAVIIFDGFDAARGETQRAGILRLIRRAVMELKGLWNTVVSVRTFDARKSAQLLELFPDSSRETSELGIRCRHLLIPSLTLPELEQAFQQRPTIGQLYHRGSDDFRELLSVPFSLWLVDRVLGAGVDASELSQVTSEVQLLEMYWKRRVSSPQDADDRRFLLAKATGTMVAKHTLSVRREIIYEPHARNAWEGLLSDEILSESKEGDSLVAFTHNILFDFAVSALLLDRDPIRFAEFVAEEPARPLFLRPSLVYHFTRLWHFDRDCFWRNFWSVVRREEMHLRQIIRLVLPAVIVRELRALADAAPLLQHLAEGDPQGANAAGFLVQALRVLNPKRAEVWAEFVRSLSPYLNQRFAWDAGIIALGWVESKTPANPLVHEACGDFGRRLLDWSWKMRSEPARAWFERLAGLLAIPLVAKTFGSNSKESYQLLAQILDALDEPGFPIDCIFRLTHEVSGLIPQSPELVGIIYERVFGHEEKSSEQTNMGGPVLPLLSNRRQDYDGCQYSLLQSYQLFLEKSPLLAVRSGIRALQAYALRDHLLRSPKPDAAFNDLQQPFVLRERQACYVQDASAIWDEGNYPDQELKLATDLFAWLHRAAGSGDVRLVSNFLDVFTEEAALAFLWKRLMGVGSETPSVLGELLWELCLAKPILIGTDVQYELGRFLEKVAPLLSRDKREKIEREILKLPYSVDPDESIATLQQRRNRLIGCIPPEALVTPEGIELRREMEAQNALEPNRPLLQMSSSWTKVSEDEILREQGANPELPENAALRNLYRRLKEWTEKGRDEAQIDGLLPTAERLRDALLNNPDAEEPVVLSAWTHLFDFGSNALCRTKEVGTYRFALLRDLVLRAVEHPEPEPNPEHDANWRSACWSPAPRNEAAEALPWLSHLQKDERVLSAIRKLALDPVPSVRFLLSHDLWRVGENAPDVMWTLLERLVSQETNAVVLKGVSTSLSHASRWNKPRAFELVKRLLARREDDSNASEGFWNDTACILTDYAVRDREPSAVGILAGWRTEPLRHVNALATSGHRLIGYIRPQQNRASFLQARELLLGHLDAAASGLAELHKSAETSGQKVSPEMWRGLYGLIDESVMRIYFAADIDPNLRQRNEHPLDDTTRPQFFRDALPVLEKVLSFGSQPTTGMLLAPTAHHFMELLNGVLRYDPPLVMRLAAEVVECSKRFNYPLDSMAMKESVALVEAILADYRVHVQDEISLKHLLNLLDAFAEAGWPDALNLVWRLDEIYR